MLTYEEFMPVLFWSTIAYIPIKILWIAAAEDEAPGIWVPWIVLGILSTLGLYFTSDWLGQNPGLVATLLFVLYVPAFVSYGINLASVLGMRISFEGQRGLFRIDRASGVPDVLMVTMLYLHTYLARGGPSITLTCIVISVSLLGTLLSVTGASFPYYEEWRGSLDRAVLDAKLQQEQDEASARLFGRTRSADKSKDPGDTSSVFVLLIFWIVDHLTPFAAYVISPLIFVLLLPDPPAWIRALGFFTASIYPVAEITLTLVKMAARSTILKASRAKHAR